MKLQNDLPVQVNMRRQSAEQSRRDTQAQPATSVALNNQVRLTNTRDSAEGQGIDDSRLFSRSLIWSRVAPKHSNTVWINPQSERKVV